MSHTGSHTRRPIELVERALNLSRQLSEQVRLQSLVREFDRTPVWQWVLFPWKHRRLHELHSEITARIRRIEELEEATSSPVIELTAIPTSDEPKCGLQ